MARGLVLALFSTLVIGCVGEISGGPVNTEEQTPEQLVAIKAWTDNAEPALRNACVSCHASQLNINFLPGEGMAMREALLAWAPAVVNLDAPSSSRILTKGPHSGPAFASDKIPLVLDWIQKEKIAAGSLEEEIILESPAVRPQLCTGGVPGDLTCPINTIPLDSMGLVGATITFVAQPTESALYLQRITLNPGPSGAYIEHPLFVTFPAGVEPKPDTLDRYFNVKLNLAAGAAPEMIQGGAAVFVGFSALDDIRIHFKAVDVFQTEETGPGTDPGTAAGCKVLESFKTNARGPLQASCASCHANPANTASSAVSMIGLDSADDLVLKQACDQILLRTNRQDIPNSSIFLAPAPTNTNHPFRFADAGQLEAFRTPVSLWITNERDAP